MNHLKKSVWVYCYPFAAALAIAFYFLFGEHLTDTVVASELSALVTLFSGILLLFFYAVKYSFKEIKKEVSTHPTYLLMVGILLTVGYFLSFKAMDLTTATSVTVFTAVEPIICFVFAYFGIIVPKEPLGKRSLLVIVALVGSVLVSKLSMGTSVEIKIGTGELLAILSATAFALGILVSKRILQTDSKKSIIVIGSALIIGGFLLNIGLLLSGGFKQNYHVDVWLYIGGIAFFVALSWVFFYISLASRLGAAITDVLYQSKILFVFLFSLIAAHFGLLKLKTITSPLITFIGILLIVVFSILLILFHNQDTHSD